MSMQTSVSALSSLISLYKSQRMPLLTVIHVRYKRNDYSLSSGRDPLNIGGGEAGMCDNDTMITQDSIRWSISLKKPHRDNTKESLKIIMTNIAILCNRKVSLYRHVSTSAKIQGTEDLLLEN